MGWRSYDYGYGGWARYVPVAERRRNAAREAARIAKKEKRALEPVTIEGRTIASTFWGKAWCENLEAYRDYDNRLPRGRTYVRNGSVIDLRIAAGKITALVSGSTIYKVAIAIKPLEPARFRAIGRECAGQIDSVVELLRGKVSAGVMSIMTRKGEGLFPAPREIDFDCSCPDYADTCKHIAAVLYGVGARLDAKPELLFVLRNVDHAALVSQVAAGRAVARPPAVGKDKVLAAADLGGIFGIELEAGAKPPAAAPKTKAKRVPGRARSRGAGTRITAKELVARGIPHPTIQNWLRAGVLERTDSRGVYRTTERTEGKVQAHRRGALDPA